MKKYVELYETKEDGSQEVVAEFILEKGIVRFMPMGGFFLKGLKILALGEEYVPEDGLVYLEKLKYHFKSAYLRASDVKEEE